MITRPDQFFVPDFGFLTSSHETYKLLVNFFEFSSITDIKNYNLAEMFILIT